MHLYIPEEETPVPKDVNFLGHRVRVTSRRLARSPAFCCAFDRDLSTCALSIQFHRATEPGLARRRRETTWWQDSDATATRRDGRVQLFDVTVLSLGVCSQGRSRSRLPDTCLSFPPHWPRVHYTAQSCALLLCFANCGMDGYLLRDRSAEYRPHRLKSLSFLRSIHSP